MLIVYCCMIIGQLSYYCLLRGQLLGFLRRQIQRGMKAHDNEASCGKDERSRGILGIFHFVIALGGGAPTRSWVLPRGSKR